MMKCTAVTDLHLQYNISISVMVHIIIITVLNTHYSICVLLLSKTNDMLAVI